MSRLILWMFSALLLAASASTGLFAAGRPMADKLLLSTDSALTVWQVDLTEGPALIGDGVPDMTAPLGGSSGFVPMINDLNGDGIFDRVLIQNSPGCCTVWSVDISDGGSNTSVLGDGTPDFYSTFGAELNLVAQQPLLGDMNGDGRADRVLYDRAQGLWIVDLAPSVGANVWGDGNPEYYSLFGAPAGAQIPSVGDINGDGLADRIMYSTFDGMAKFEITYTSSSTNLGNSALDRIIVINSDQHQPMPNMEDMDGDGLADLVLLAQTAGCCTTWVIYTSSTGYETYIESPFGAENSRGLVGHFGGPLYVKPPSRAREWELY